MDISLEVSTNGQLTHCSLVTQDGDKECGQHWFRKRLGAWRHPAITGTNIDLTINLKNKLMVGSNDNIINWHYLYHAYEYMR